MQTEVKWLMEYLDSRPVLKDIETAMDNLWKYSCKQYSYASKNRRIREWDPTEEECYAILCHILTGVFTNPQGMTYQAMIGYIAGGIGCADPLDRAKCAAEVIAIAFKSGLVVITKVSDDTFMVTTEYVLKEDMPVPQKHRPEFKQPEPSLFNPILGNRFKQHDKDICVDHIERMNAIPLSLEFRVIDALEETVKSGETPEQVTAAEDFLRRSKEMYQMVADQGNQFWLKHNMDTRGRSYCEGYLVNYQGSSYKKAIVCLANKEIVKL